MMAPPERGIFMTRCVKGVAFFNRKGYPNDIKNAPSFSIFKLVIKPFLRVRQNAT